MFLRTTLFVCLLSHSVKHISAAHAGFHVQYPWMSRAPHPSYRSGLDQYNPFCGDIIHNPQRFSRRSRTFLSFSGHPGDLVTVLYSRHRVPKKRDDFQHIVLQDVPIQLSGQLCVNVTIPFETEAEEMGVMLFEATDPKTENVEYHCTDIKMTDMNTLPEDHPAMCAAYNRTLIPMPDEWLGL